MLKEFPTQNKWGDTFIVAEIIELIIQRLRRASDILTNQIQANRMLQRLNTSLFTDVAPSGDKAFKICDVLQDHKILTPVTIETASSQMWRRVVW